MPAIIWKNNKEFNEFLSREQRTNFITLDLDCLCQAETQLNLLLEKMIQMSE